MKKSFAIAALTLGAIVLGTNTVQAQDKTDATTTATITIKDVISIESGSAAGGKVSFNYATAADYNKVQKVEQANALKVTSSKPFHVKVRAGGENFTNQTDAQIIPLEVLSIKATSGNMMTTTTTKRDIEKLSNSDQVLVENAPKGSEKILNLDYEIPAAMAQEHILGKTAGTYTQTVIYTVTN